MQIKTAILCLSFLFTHQQNCSEQYYCQVKRNGTEIRINPFKGESFNFNLNFSEKAPNLEVLVISGIRDFDEYYSHSDEDLGLSKNLKLKEIRVQSNKHFLKVFSKSNIPTLTHLSLSGVSPIESWNFLSAFPNLASLSVECADCINFTQLLKAASACKKLEDLKIYFDDYITRHSTRPSNKQIRLLASLIRLKSLTFGYYRILTSRADESEKSYYKKFAKELKLKLPSTEVEVILTEHAITP